MKTNRSVAFASILFVLGCHSQAALADDLGEQLKSDYIGKTLTLRHFYEGKQLTFESDGSLVGSAEVGPWTVFGQILVKTIGVNERSLQIHARRVCLTFDEKTRFFRDVLDYLKDGKPEDTEGPKKFYETNDVDVDINLTSAQPNEQDISAAMNAVFLVPGDSMRDLVPDYWRGYFGEKEGQPRSGRDPTETVYSVKLGEVSSPRAINRENPEFSEWARLAHYQATGAISLVVDPSGLPRDLEIESPQGLGLDEKSIEAVSKWKFEPGMREGQPVPVKITVELEFHLY
jgi:TonB family protein